MAQVVTTIPGATIYSNAPASSPSTPQTSSFGTSGVATTPKFDLATGIASNVPIGSTSQNGSTGINAPAPSPVKTQAVPQNNSVTQTQTPDQTQPIPVKNNPIINSPQAPVINSQSQVTGQQGSSIQSSDQTAQKYQQAYQNVVSNNGQAPQSGGAAMSTIQNATSQYQAPQTPYQPTQAFMSVGDPIMQSFVQSALGYQQEVVDTGYTAKYLQATLGNQVQSLDLQAANIQNIMNGSRDDIRAEIGKAGGFATESQVEGLVTTRNRDLLKQYNNLELQKQTMQNQMNLQVQLAQEDHQYAVDKFNNVLQVSNMYKGIYSNFTDQLDKQFQSGGFQSLADISQGNPYYQSVIENHLQLPQGTLSNPQQVQKLQNDSYRNQSLGLSNARFSAMYGYPANVNNSQSPVSSPSSSASPASSGSTTSTPTSNGLSYAQYGLLAKTDFNPKSSTDTYANNYLTNYLNGQLPTKASDIGISVKGAGAGTSFNNAKTRAENLYYAATGQNMPPPEVIKNNLGLINANNKLTNNLAVQEKTVESNFGVSLQNLNTNNLNTAWPVLNGVINGIKNAEGDPATAQYIAQNSTIQQELGNLLAVKNASGTTVYDKVAGAGLMPRNATPQQQVQIVKTLLMEAKNAASSISSANGELYKSVDPFQRQENNPNRFGSTRSGKSFNYQGAKAAGWSDKDIEDYTNSN